MQIILSPVWLGTYQDNQKVKFVIEFMEIEHNPRHNHKSTTRFKFEAFI